MLHQLLCDIGRKHPQALIYPLTVAAHSLEELEMAARHAREAKEMRLRHEAEAELVRAVATAEASAREEATAKLLIEQQASYLQ